MPALPARIYQNLDRYPSFLLSADQWHERGWVYDPETGQLLKYKIDRKDQHDSVSVQLSRTEFSSQVLPDASLELRAWFASIDAPGSSLQD